MVVPSGVLECGACLKEPPALDACLTAVDYAYPWAQAIREFKFHGDTGWSAPLSTLLSNAPWVEPALEAADWVLPIPLSQQRLRERGFNQAALIAKQLAPHKTKTQVLLRLQDTAAQSGLTRTQRMRNLQQAFMVEPTQVPVVQGLKVVLVDDVMTTGATLNAAATVLRSCGVTHITGIAVARTPLD